MLVQMATNKSDHRQIFKEVVMGLNLNGDFRDEIDLIRPVFTFDDDSIVLYNYCYIPSFRRYYYITNVTCVRTGIWRAEMLCDVLMSFKNDIANYKVVVNKQSMVDNADEYIDDGSLVADSKVVIETIDFPKGFNALPTTVLILAG